MPTGLRNSITDVSGLAVGNAHDETLASGVTAIICEAATVAAASVFGGGPGTREMDAIALEGSVGAADAIVLSGGSAFGLDAAGGVQSYLREKGPRFRRWPRQRSHRAASDPVRSSQRRRKRLGPPRALSRHEL